METFPPTHLTGIHSAIRVSRADKVLVDGLEVTAIAVLVPPNGQFRLPLAGGLLATVICGSPTYNSGPTSRESLLGRHANSLGQAHGNHILGFPHRLVQNQNGNVVIETNAGEAILTKII